MSEKQRLYRVVTVGLGTHYAVAPDASSAYQMMRDQWDAKNYGIDAKRQMVRVELLAETGEYHDGTERLWISGGH